MLLGSIAKNKYDKIFPVYCGEKECKSQYDLRDFTEIILLWGFICLTNGKNTYLGFTCPNCLKTTIKKYPRISSYTLIQYIEEKGIDSEKRYRGINPFLRTYVPFYGDGNGNTDRAVLMSNGRRRKKISPYYLPSLAKPVVQYKDRKFLPKDLVMQEESIPESLDIENTYGQKVFPRLVGSDSIYKKADRLLVENPDPIRIIKNLIETQYGEKRACERDPDYYEWRYSRRIEDDLSLDDYNGIFASATYKNPERIKDLNGFIQYYEKIRSRIYFDLNYRVNFVNKFARSIFHDDIRECNIQERPDSENDGTTDKKNELIERASELEDNFDSLKNIVSQDPAVQELKCKISEIAKFDSDILIYGETGTGKELFARAIHQVSGREGDFIPVNCGSIPKDLFESELFGHLKGAFTGAVANKKGAFELANHGTLFLDELGELPLEMQSKLLRAVEYREIKPVGGEDFINLDVKLVFATNRNLEKEVNNQGFRKDLFFRISSPSLNIPPLRERSEDIPLLTDHFRIIFNQKYNKNISSISPELIDILRKYAWPGNVRELMKALEIAVMQSDGPMISQCDLGETFTNVDDREETQHIQNSAPATKITDDEIRFWMKKLNNNKSQVARKLGVSYRTILRRTKNLSL